MPEASSAKSLLQDTLHKIQSILDELKFKKDAFILFESICYAMELLVTTCLEQVETIKGLYNKQVDMYEKYRNAMHFIQTFSYKFNSFLLRKMMPSRIPRLKTKTMVNQPSVQQPIAKEPSVQQPIAKEPIAKEPIAKEPSVQQPSARVDKNKVQSSSITDRTRDAMLKHVKRLNSVKNKPPIKLGGKKNATKRKSKTMRPKKNHGAKTRRHFNLATKRTKIRQ